jgi:hypothetical protein
MRKVWLTFMALCLAVALKADCAGTGLYVWPKGNMIKKNPVIMLEGYAESQHVILGLNKKHRVYLKNGENKIQLAVKETLVGDFYLTQALLMPSDTLEPGKEYELGTRERI